MKAHTSETQATITPEKALLFLQEGNQRFVNNLKINRNLLEQVTILEKDNGLLQQYSVVSTVELLQNLFSTKV